LFRSGATLASVGLLFACGGETEVFLGSPDLGAAKSVLIAIEHLGQPPEVHAFHTFPIRLSVDPSSSERIELSVLGLNQTLAELELSEGVVRRAAPPVQTVAELQPTSSWVSAISGDEVGVLIEKEPSRAVLEFPIRTNDACPELTIEPLPDWPHTRYVYGRLLRDGTPLVHDQNTLMRFRPDRSFETWSSTTGALILAVNQSDDDQVFLLATDGLHEVEPTVPLQTRRVADLGPTVVDEQLLSVFVLRTEPSLELLSLSVFGVLFRYRDGAWAEIFRAPPEVKREPQLDRPTLFSLEGGLVVAMAHSLTQLIEIDGDRVRLVSLGGVHKGFAATLEDERGRLIVDTQDGQTYRYQVGLGWRPDFAGELTHVFSITPWRSGYVLASDTRPLRAVFPDSGLLCSAPTIGTFQRLKVVLNVRGRLLVGGSEGSGVDAWSWITAPDAE
jgi:hypothetical protein